MKGILLQKPITAGEKGIKFGFNISWVFQVKKRKVASD
jgi:hypothetical protein